MRFRNGFSVPKGFGFTPVSIPTKGLQEYLCLQRQLIYRNMMENDIGESVRWARSKVRGEAESLVLKWLGPLHSDRENPMETGIGVITEVEETLWIMENPRYPAQERYIGKVKTIAGEELFFVSDIDIPVDQNYWKAIGRFDKDKQVIEIADFYRTNEGVA